MDNLQFRDYKFNKLQYEYNPNFDYEFDEKKEPTIENKVEVSIEYLDNNLILIINLEAGNNDSPDSPFTIVAEIHGFFTYSELNDKEENISKEIIIEGITTLYPYLRSAVANLTNLTNDLPTYNLPLIDKHVFDIE